jgi:CRP/FNR family transcriptional regulator, dissimilatory nitrate respiration regulator
LPIHTDTLLKRLRTFEFLRGLDDGILAELAQQAGWNVYPADAVIFWEGDIEAHLYYLQYGWLKIIKTGPDGREQVLRFLGPGEIFNEIGVFARKPNPATAITLEEAGIWRIPRTALEQVLLRYPHTGLQIMESMADRVISLVSLTADLSLRPVEARLAKLLLEQAKGEDDIPRQRWATLTEMAAYLGTVPDVLSRAVRGLTQAGLIEMDKQHIRILNRPGLMERAMLQEV